MADKPTTEELYEFIRLVASGNTEFTTLESLAQDLLARTEQRLS